MAQLHPHGWLVHVELLIRVLLQHTMVKKLIFASEERKFFSPKAHAASRSYDFSRPPSRSLQRTIPLSPLAPRFGKGNRSWFCLPW